ncbi:M23 family metallopeptidase [Luteipulveratus halotolerans]|uniref:M23 family metallopeptidase n=1 Tax=Luteipulveratus halotolerans TaxID=1631356 RepID=UPI000682AC6C|nr:M23 family metallopeptidase [Luteipulveratus halotolerans]
MRTRHQITGAAIVAASALGGVGLTLAGPSGTADATPAVSSTAASTSCTTASRVFQLRGGGTQIWAASISKANSTKPSVYGWQKVYTVTGAKGLSIAAHSEGKESIQILLSDQTGALRSLAYNKKDGKVTSARTLAKGGTTTKPGAYRFTSLTSDGTRVWGAGSGRLTVMTGISTTKAPTGRSTVAGLKGFYPAAFWANAGGSYEIAWTDSKGNVRYGNISATKGWHLANTTTVAKGWTSDAITTPGAGIVLRSSGDNLVRHHVNPSAKTGKVTRTTTLTKTFKAPNTIPMTTVPDTCKTTAPPQSSSGYSLPLDKGAQPRSEYDDPHHDYPSLDLAVPTGTSVKAIRGGRVTHVGGGCGNGVQISADDGGSYVYCHLSTRSVAPGATVKAGQLIGKSGNTGHSTGPHLHVQLKTGSTLRCPQPLLLAVYDGKTAPSLNSLPTSGCSY